MSRVMARTLMREDTMSHRLITPFLASSLAFGMIGCALEDELQPEQVEPDDEQLEEVTQELIACPSGFHPHTVTWGTTAFHGWEQCAVSHNIHYGRQVCMISGSQGRSCGGEWVVPAAIREGGAWWYGGVKIRALDGH
jgi:hypothetical protein